MRPRTFEYDEDEIGVERPDWRARLQQWLLHHPRDAVALVAAIAGVGIITINALFLQAGPHPAPLFALRPAAPPTPPDMVQVAATDAMVPRRRPGLSGRGQVEIPRPRSRAELVAEIQRELARRGFYTGAVDGVFGPKTDTAVRDFAQHAQIKVPAEPNDALLRTIAHSQAAEVRPAPTASMTRHQRDPIADLIGPSSRILAVQRALSDYGYGQIMPTGIVGAETVAAIEKFERARQMPVTGQMSDRLVRELAAVTGRPLE